MKKVIVSVMLLIAVCAVAQEVQEITVELEEPVDIGEGFYLHSLRFVQGTIMWKVRGKLENRSGQAFDRVKIEIACLDENEDLIAIAKIKIVQVKPGITYFDEWALYSSEPLKKMKSVQARFIQ